MVVCPLCNHTQTVGAVCDECGKVLARTLPAAAPVVPLEEMMNTRFEPTSAPPDDGLGANDLEPTAESRLPSYDIARAVDLEDTRLPAAPASPAAALAELDTGRAEFLGARTVLAEQVLCRYCRQPHARGGLLCPHCGMRLPTARREGVAAPRPAAPTPARCPGCGAPALSGQRCGDCGTEVRSG